MSESRRRTIRKGDRVRTDEGIGIAKYPKGMWQGSYGDWWVEFDGKPGKWKDRADLVLIERNGQSISDRMSA